MDAQVRTVPNDGNGFVGTGHEDQG
jgi:hypothetical protein